MRQKKITKEEVLVCASQIIKEEGLDSCTIRNLAAHLDVAVGTLYNYFSSHDEMLQEVFRSSWASTIDKLETIVKSVDKAEDKLAMYCRIMIKEVKNRKGLGNIVLNKQVASLTTDDINNKLFNNLSSIIQEIIKDGDSNKHLPDNTIEMLSRWILLALLSHIGIKDCSDEEFIIQLTKRFL